MIRWSHQDSHARQRPMGEEKVDQECHATCRLDTAIESKFSQGEDGRPFREGVDLGEDPNRNGKIVSCSPLRNRRGCQVDAHFLFRKLESRGWKCRKDTLFGFTDFRSGKTQDLKSWNLEPRVHFDMDETGARSVTIKGIHGKWGRFFHPPMECKRGAWFLGALLALQKLILGLGQT